MTIIHNDTELTPFDDALSDEDPDGLGAARGMAVALAIVVTILAIIFGAPMLIGWLSQ